MEKDDTKVNERKECENKTDVRLIIKIKDIVGSGIGKNKKKSSDNRRR